MDLEKYGPARVLYWNVKTKKYEASSSRFDYKILRVSEASTDTAWYRTLLFWREFARMEELKESAHIISQIIGTVSSAEESEEEEASEERIVLAYGGGLAGVSIFNFGGTTEGAPKIRRKTKATGTTSCTRRQIHSRRSPGTKEGPLSVASVPQ